MGAPAKCQPAAANDRIATQPRPPLQAVLVAPVMVGMFVPEGSLFEFYVGSLWPASSCPLPPGPPNPAKAVVNHAVLVVGWNSLAKPPYW